MDDQGNLYYGTADFRRAPQSQSLVRFTRDQVLSATENGPLDFQEDGQVVLDGLDGFFNMTWYGGKLYVSELGFTSGTGSVFVIEPLANYRSWVLASFPPTFLEDGRVVSPSFLAFRPGTRDFSAGAGPKGGALAVAYSDFGEVNRITEIIPELYFVRGRVNGDDKVDISDAVALLSFLFGSGEAPDPLDAGDLNKDGSTDISDAIYLLDYLFRGGPVIPGPYPEPGPDR